MIIGQHPIAILISIACSNIMKVMEIHAIVQNMFSLEKKRLFVSQLVRKIVSQTSCALEDLVKSSGILCIF